MTKNAKFCKMLIKLQKDLNAPAKEYKAMGHTKDKGGKFTTEEEYYAATNIFNNIIELARSVERYGNKYCS